MHLPTDMFQIKATAIEVLKPRMLQGLYLPTFDLIMISAHSSQVSHTYSTVRRLYPLVYKSSLVNKDVDKRIQRHCQRNQ